MTILTREETIGVPRSGSQRYRYLILDQLGEGGSAITYQARNLETNRQVAY